VDERGLSFGVQPRHVYVHVPFCARRCAYCDFSIAVRKVVPVDEYITALGNELAIRFAAERRWTVDTLYFGGGTPSRLGESGVERAIVAMRDYIDLAPGAELTVEANPEDVTLEAATAWRHAGVNRLSIGAQSFDDGVLHWMHRTHDASAIRRAVDAARAGGIENISLDLIFALPDTVERSWERDVANALELEPSHVSLYGLTVEPHTPFGRRKQRGELNEAPDERYEREFLFAHEAMTAAGLEHYEVSNFGRSDSRSRHNSSYWAGVPYAGLGPSAHEFDGAARRWNKSAYVEWLHETNAGRDPIDQSETLTDENKSAERAYLGLRTIGGLELSAAETERTRLWVEAGWARRGSDKILRLTPLGWLRLDALAADLTLAGSRY
jgi:oxygen-independent coproporphyrinogen-3 oxidase